jgi:hypothetical protein
MSPEDEQLYWEEYLNFLIHSKEQCEANLREALEPKYSDEPEDNLSFRQFVDENWDRICEWLSPDGQKELKIAKSCDYQFFRFFEEDLIAFTVALKRLGKNDTQLKPIPGGSARTLWKRDQGTDREPEDFYS